MKELLKKAGDIPVLSLSLKIPGIGSILLENKQTIEKIVEHLITKHNCKKIGFISGPKESPEGNERLAGYQTMLNQYDIPYNPDYICYQDFVISGGIEGTRLLLDEIINNILSNAVKFVDHVEGEIILSLIDQDDTILISIKDNGLGIPTDKLETIFNRFEQVHKQINTKYSGTGIGLAFCKQLSSYLKGKIWAVSQGIGTGSTFFLELPKEKKIFEEANDINIEIIKNPSNRRLDSRRKDIKDILKDELEMKKSEQANQIYLADDYDQDQTVSNHYFALIVIVDDNKTIRDIIMKYLKKRGI